MKARICTQCGAPLPENTNRCEYCGMTYSTTYGVDKRVSIPDTLSDDDVLKAVQSLGTCTATDVACLLDISVQKAKVKLISLTHQGKLCSITDARKTTYSAQTETEE